MRLLKIGALWARVRKCPRCQVLKRAKVAQMCATHADQLADLLALIDRTSLSEETELYLSEISCL